VRKTRLPLHPPQLDSAVSAVSPKWPFALSPLADQRPYIHIYNIHIYIWVFFAPHTHFTPGDSRAAGSRRVFLYTDIKKRTDLLILSRILRGGEEYVYMTCMLPLMWVSRLNRFGEGPDAMLFRTLHAWRGCNTHNIRSLFDTTHTNIGIISIILYIFTLLYGCCI